MQPDAFNKEGKLMQLLYTKNGHGTVVLVCSILLLSLQPTMFLVWILRDPVLNVVLQLTLPYL